ncbi:hypothetical protein [Actinomadura rugatobispora]|uniref:Ankyrin repeat domain-containing protein n=1 Tax=Actinomadura rugatobispora TaxID=1994 RepID=A0ABW1A4T8_9ACTN|nr:hypothetical protein GCM10010200_048080 [Actinomadura rugatobispora]
MGRPGTAACPPFGRKAAGFWERERRYGTPRWRIERATERRLAGDWLGACRAAGVDVGFDLAEVASEHGARVAERLERDLLHLAPDLLRWHLSGDADAYALAAYGKSRLFLSWPEGLGFGAKPDVLLAPGHVWDVRRSGELLARLGGRGRAPFFEADGTPREPPEVPDGPVERAERLTALFERGAVQEAFAEAGIELLAPGNARALEFLGRVPLVGRVPLDLHRIEKEVRLLGGGRFLVQMWRFSLTPNTWDAQTDLLLETMDDRLRVTWMRPGDVDGPADPLPELFWRRSPDLDLVRAGRLTPDELHPLVREALFPERVPDGPVGPGGAPPEVARVRCRGEWHEVSFRRGELRVHAHTDEERRREGTLRALGGTVPGCFTVRERWDGDGFLPRALREQRRELFHRVECGDTEGVLRCLESGFDAHARDGDGRSLLHWLHVLDHEVLLPRLLDEGFDLEARDVWGRSPLVAAVANGASAAAVRALIGAGACADVSGGLPAEIARIWNRKDLAFLQDAGE